MEKDYLKDLISVRTLFSLVTGFIGFFFNVIFYKYLQNPQNFNILNILDLFYNNKILTLFKIQYLPISLIFFIIFIIIGEAFLSISEIFLLYPFFRFKYFPFSTEKQETKYFEIYQINCTLIPISFSIKQIKESISKIIILIFVLVVLIPLSICIYSILRDNSVLIFLKLVIIFIIPIVFLTLTEKFLFSNKKENNIVLTLENFSLLYSSSPVIKDHWEYFYNLSRIFAFIFLISYFLTAALLYKAEFFIGYISLIFSSFFAPCSFVLGFSIINLIITIKNTFFLSPYDPFYFLQPVSPTVTNLSFLLAIYFRYRANILVKSLEIQKTQDKNY